MVLIKMQELHACIRNICFANILNAKHEIQRLLALVNKFFASIKMELHKHLLLGNLNIKLLVKEIYFFGHLGLL